MRWLLILLLAAVPAAAQEGGATFPPDASGGGGASYDGGSVTNPFLAPDGTAALPGYGWTNDPGTGWWRRVDANTSHQYFFETSAGAYNNAGHVLDIDRADNAPGQTRTFFRVWDPDATTQVAGFWHVTSADWTNATSMTLYQWDSNFATFKASNSLNTNQVTLGDYQTAATDTGNELLLIGSGTSNSPRIRFSPYDGVNFFYTDLTMTYPTANRVITLQDGSGTLAFLSDTGASFPLLGPNGTVGAPTYSFSGSTNVGMTHGGTGLGLIWGGAYEVLIASSDTKIGGHLLPLVSNTYDLGQGGLIWNDLALNGEGRAGLGTVTAPSWSFVSDNNTGIYRLTTDQMGFTANGVNRLTVGLNGLQLIDSGTQPTCDATTRGVLWVEEGGAGVRDDLEICLKSDSDTYAWVAIVDGGA